VCVWICARVLQAFVCMCVDLCVYVCENLCACVLQAFVCGYVCVCFPDSYLFAVCGNGHEWECI
jgi:hypothetical protein